MKKAKNIFLCIALAALLLDIIFIIVSTASNGRDYTKAYSIHKEISALSSSDEAIAYLTENKIPYTLSNGSLSLDSYNVTYTIKEGKLIPCKKLTRLAKLDNANDDDLAIETYENNGEYSQRVSFETFFVEYYKINNNYFIKFTGLFNLLKRFCSIAAGICIGLYITQKD